MLCSRRRCARRCGNPQVLAASDIAVAVAVLCVGAAIAAGLAVNQAAADADVAQAILDGEAGQLWEMPDV